MRIQLFYMDRQNLKRLLISSLNPQLCFQNPKVVKVQFQKRVQFKGELPNRSVTLKYPIKKHIKIFSPPLTTYQTQSYQKFKANIENWKNIQNPSICQIGKKKSKLLKSGKLNEVKRQNQFQSQLSFQNSTIGFQVKQDSLLTQQTIRSKKTTQKQVGKIVEIPLKKRRNSLSNLIEARVLQRKKSMTRQQLNKIFDFKKGHSKKNSQSYVTNHKEIQTETSKSEIQKSKQSFQIQYQNYPKSDDPFVKLQTCISIVENMNGKINQLRSSINKNLQRNGSVIRSSSAISIKYKQQELNSSTYKFKYGSPSIFTKSDSRYYQDKREFLEQTKHSERQNGSYLKSLERRFGDLSNIAKATSSSYIYQPSASKNSLFFETS